MPRPLVGKRQRGHVKRHLKAQEPQIFEGAKTTLLLRGHSTSEMVTAALRDLNALCSPNCKVLSRKNQVLPFEERKGVEFLCQKNDAGLFVLGSHNKKRPNNLVFGRTFDGAVLDMIELGVTDFVSMKELHKISHVSRNLGSPACMLFQGDAWTRDATLRTLQSLMLDMFKGVRFEEVDLAALDHVIVFTSVDDKIMMRTYGVGFVKGKGAAAAAADEDANMSDDEDEEKVGAGPAPKIELLEMGPSMNLKVRRSRLADENMRKAALRLPKGAKGAKKQKNVSRNALEGKVGQVHMKRQDMDKLVMRSRFKGLKRGQAGSKRDDAQKGQNKRARK